mmetsp:Transcript_27722/g.49974  ORF Transcript_27722/g.49974 Transcript_27722/m.49974 type:complete len:242 (+) Transcript_27722:462-1187(+)
MMGNRNRHRFDVEHHMPPATWHVHHLACLRLALKKSWGRTRLLVVPASPFGKRYGGHVILTSIARHNDAGWGDVGREEQPAFAAADGEIPSAGAVRILVPRLARSYTPNQQPSVVRSRPAGLEKGKEIVAKVRWHIIGLQKFRCRFSEGGIEAVERLVVAVGMGVVEILAQSHIDATRVEYAIPELFAQRCLVPCLGRGGTYARTLQHHRPSRTGLVCRREFSHVRHIRIMCNPLAWWPGR